LRIRASLAVGAITVPAVHEQVHQWAAQQQQERQCAEEVGAVFAQQDVRGNRAECEQTERMAEAPERQCAVWAWLLDRLC